MSSQQWPHWSRDGDLQSEEYFLDVDGRLERHGGLGSLSGESSEEEEEESAADQPAEEPEGSAPGQVQRVERELGDEATDAVRELRRRAGLREELGEHPECYIEYNMLASCSG